MQHLSEATSVTDSLSRLQAIFRTITESTITVSDSISRLLSTFRIITESTIAVGLGIVTTISPSSIRHIFDLGAKFDSVSFQHTITI